MGNHAFFFLWPGFTDFFHDFRGVTDIYWEQKLKPLVVSWNQTKKEIKTLGLDFAVAASASADRQAASAKSNPRVSTIFCLVSWIPTKVFKFLLAINIREYPWNHQKNQWNPCHKIKKICVVYHEILLWW